jgi:DNA ligase-1
MKRKASNEKRTEEKVSTKKRDQKADSKNKEGPTTTGSIDVMLAHCYEPDKHDPSGWLMSEKMDGIRCYWSGQTLYTRTGKLIHAPKEWKAKLPKIALDGELWSGRDDFQNIVSIVRKVTPVDSEWDQIKFMIFDAPLLKEKFSDRLKTIERVTKGNSLCKMIKQVVCKSKDHLETLMDEICGGKGEGVMIKNPDSDYERKRSWQLLKVKRFEDAEAKVVGHQRGTGRCTGMLGALECREKDGTEFKIGSGFDDA